MGAPTCLCTHVQSVLELLFGARGIRDTEKFSQINQVSVFSHLNCERTARNTLNLSSQTRGDQYFSLVTKGVAGQGVVTCCRAKSIQPDIRV